MPTPRRARMLPVVLCALAGAAAAIGLAALDVQSSQMGWVALIQPGTDGDAASLIMEDFPDVELLSGRGHDGQYFYAAARGPTDTHELTGQLDRPRYRLQRPLFSALSWALHPTGGGYGLVAAMAIVGSAALVLLGIGAGGLSVHLGGPAWIAGVVPLLPGPIWSFRLGLADNLALGLALLCVLSAIEGRQRRAVVLAVLAVLTKEAILVLIVAHALFHRRRSSGLAAAAAASAVAAWWLVLRLVIESNEPNATEFAFPLAGIAGNVGHWSSGSDLLAASMVVFSLALALVVLFRRGPAHPLFGPLLASAGFGLILGVDVLGLDHNGTRAIAPTLVLAILVLVTPSASPRMAKASDAEVATGPTV